MTTTAYNIMEVAAQSMTPLSILASSRDHVYVGYNENLDNSRPPFFFILAYIRDDDRKLKAIPIDDQLPPETRRRILVLQRLGRREDPKCFRILDICPPKCLDPLEGKAMAVQFIQVDIIDKISVDGEALPDNEESPISVFNTATNIRFYERHASLIPLSAKVGAQNIIDVLEIHSSCFLLCPWREEPKHFVQVINDDDKLIPKIHKEFSNYGYTKRQAEVLLRGANGQTGYLRPGNGIFGAGGDILCGAYLVRKTNPT
ncbi:hypothetical protein EDD85DRAFT_793140 [Armillaria nabsnona]|nr:hypothetical protein EDD85DRAFT_793140 [Armillaria nabsnona]